MDENRISNRCPACGGQTLFVASGGWLTCSWLGCPKPTSMTQMLEEVGLYVIRTTQLQHEIDEACREALAMRAERDLEISKRVIIQAVAADILRREAPASVDLAAPEIARRR